MAWEEGEAGGTENLQNGEQEEQEPDLDDTAEFEPVSSEQEEKEEQPSPARGGRIDFGQLQFGRDYEIK